MRPIRSNMPPESESHFAQVTPQARTELDTVEEALIVGQVDRARAAGAVIAREQVVAISRADVLDAVEAPGVVFANPLPTGAAGARSVRAA